MKSVGLGISLSWTLPNVIRGTDAHVRYLGTCGDGRINDEFYLSTGHSDAKRAVVPVATIYSPRAEILPCTILRLHFDIGGYMRDLGG